MPIEDRETKKKKSHLVHLIKLSKIDGELHAAEEKFLQTVADRIGLSFEEFEEVLLNPGQVAFTPPRNEKERVIQLYDLLYLMRMDGKITKQEQTICKEVGLKLGLNPFYVEEMIGIMIESLSKQVSQERLINTLKKYLN